jgi:hypothetical protein
MRTYLEQDVTAAQPELGPAPLRYGPVGPDARAADDACRNASRPADGSLQAVASKTARKRGGQLARRS